MKTQTKRQSVEWVPWGRDDSIPPVAVSCPSCQAPLLRAATDAERAAGQRGGVSLVHWQYSADEHLDLGACPACGCGVLQSPLEPIRTHADLRRLAKDRQWQAAERVRCMRDPWYVFANYLSTLDEHWVAKGLAGPYQRFPALTFLRSVVYVLWAWPFNAWPKSRQMGMTWTAAVGYVLGEACFRPGSLSMVQSKKAEDANRIVSTRMRGVYQRVRQCAPWLFPPLVRDNENELGWSNDSRVLACPQGAHHVQSNTPSRLVLDEIQLQDEAEAAYHQALPACQAMSLIGSADYSWFWQTWLPGLLEAA